MASALPIYQPKNPAGIVSTTLPRYSARRVDPSERSAGLPRYEPRDGSPGLPRYAPQSQAGFGGAGASLPQYRPPSPLPDEAHMPASTETSAPASTDPNTAGGAAGLAAGSAAPSALPTYQKPSQYQQDLQILRDMEAAPVEPTSRIQSAWTAFGAPVEPSGNLGYTLGERLGHAVSGLLDKRLGPRIQRQNQVAHQQQVVAASGAQQAAANQQATVQADINYKNSLADWNRARHGIAEDRNRAAALKTQQQALQREIGNRLKEPRPFDPSDAYDSDLATRAQGAGVSFDPKSFGDFKNPAQMEVLDPTDPTGTKKTRLVLDRASGLWQPVQVNGQGVTTGYATPVGSDGMTASQRGNLQLGGQRLGETRRHNQVTEGQGQQRINQSREFGIARIEQGEVRLAQGADRQTAARYNQLNGLIQRRNDLRAQANRWRSYTNPDDGTVQPWAEKRAQVYEDQIRSVEDRMQSQYGDLLDAAASGDDGMINGPQKAIENRGLMRTPKAPARGTRPAPSAPAQSKGNVSRAKFRQKYPQYQGASDAEVDSIIGAQGYTPQP